MKSYKVNHTISNGTSSNWEEGQIITDKDLARLDIERLVNAGAITSTDDILAATGLPLGSADQSARITELEAQLAKTPKNVKAAQEQVDALTTELKTAQDALAPFQTRNTELATKVTELEAQLADLTAFKAEMTAEEVIEVEGRVKAKAEAGK